MKYLFPLLFAMVASQAASAQPCLKNGKYANADGSLVMCRVVNGKVVPIN